jgi:hypothetical protein
MRVNSALDMGTYWAYFVEIVSGTLPVTLTAGAAVAGYGVPGDGAIRLSADDPYGPLIDIFTSGAEPWNGEIYPHVRLGRLDGVGVPGVSGILQWGMVAGENLADANSPYMVMSNLQQKMFKIASEWHDGANTTARIEPNGRARFGVNVDNPAGTFLDVDPAAGLATFRGAIEVVGTIPYGSVSGTPTLGALAAGNNLGDVPDGGGYARINSTLISGGNIRVGSGTKDADLNGFNIDSSEIVGQLAGVDQVVLGGDGKILGGAGEVTLDRNGVNVNTTHIKDTSLSMDYENDIDYSSLTPAAKYRFTDLTDSFWYGGSNYAAYAGGDVGGIAALSYFKVDPMYPNTWETIHSLMLTMPDSLPKAAATGYPSSTVVSRVGVESKGNKFFLHDRRGVTSWWPTGIYYLPDGDFYWQGIPSFRSTAA